MYLESIKMAARISHNQLDTELERLEKYACAELIRAGVPMGAVNAENELIKQAVVSRVLVEIGNEKISQKASESWEYQLDVLRKHDWNGGDGDI